MLEIEDLHVRYGRIDALRGISIRVEEGEVIGLVGPNGAGKTTTLGAVAGLLKPERGEVRFEGESLVGKTPEVIVRKGVALVPESRRIFTTMTVADNLRLGGTIRSNRKQVEEDIDHMLELFPALKRYYSGLAGLLSGGEQQQLAIARAMLSRPRLLLLDEPSLGLAPILVDLLFEALARLRDEGTTIFLVEQVVDRTTAFADRTHVLRNGQIVLTGTREELAGSSLASAYLGVRG